MPPPCGRRAKVRSRSAARSKPRKLRGGGNSKITPLAYAVVSLPEIGVATTTDVKGRFEIQLSNPGKYKVEISSLGYEPLSQTIQLPARDSLKFTLKATSFYLENIVVSAESKKTGAATASKISKSAMEHIQATSLADIMSLLPGASTRTAEEIALKKVSTFSVRNGQSFGTAIIMDGAPLSNNANMQTLSLALGAGAGPSISTPNSGVDMRTITTNNLESVEVIRGIASAQYGDIASGAVIVNSKAGRTPLSIQLDVNPNVYMASVSHGVGLGRKAGVLNYGVDYTFAQYDPTEGYDTYNRVTGRVSYSNTVGKWSTNTSFNLFYTKDKAEPNPDDARDLDLMTQRDLGLRFNTNGSFNFNKNWLKNLKYTVSANYTNKKTYREEFATNSDWTYSTSKTDGAILSSMPGQDIYLADGTKITNIPDADKNGKAWRLPSDYTAIYNLYGKELNTFAQLSANFAGDLGRTHHRLIIGGEYRATGNLGEGKVFDPETPPRRSVNTNFTTQRERAFSDVPFMHQFSLFAEDGLNNYVYAVTVWQLPGNGTDYPLKPGESFIITQEAANHADHSKYGGLIDTSLSEFETWAGNPQRVNPDVPDLEYVFWSGYIVTMQWLNTVSGPGLCIYQPGKHLEFPTINTGVVGETTQRQVGKTQEYVRIPAEQLIDGVEMLPTSNSLNMKRIPGFVDAGAASTEKIYVGKSVCRKVIGQRPDGTPIYQDTNNSTEDFETQVPQFRRNGEKMPAWNWSLK